MCFKLNSFIQSKSNHISYYFCIEMKRKLYIALFLSFIAIAAYSQQSTTTINGYMVPVCVYKGDPIPSLRLPNVYVFKPLKFKNEKERREYYRLVRNVKKTLPLARAINRAIIETYEYLETLPDKKAREKHLKLVENEIAQAGNGMYVRVDNTNNAEKALNAEINKLAKADVETQVFTEFDEQFQVLAWLALLLLAAELMILNRKNPLFKNVKLFK